MFETKITFSPFSGFFLSLFVLPPLGRPYRQTRAPAQAALFCSSKNRLRGSLRANKCSDAAYSVPGHHRIRMGPYLGIPRTPWAGQNQKKREFDPFGPPGKNMTARTPKKAQKHSKSRITQKSQWGRRKKCTKELLESSQGNR